jgi:hypothetical protein
MRNYIFKREVITSRLFIEDTVLFTAIGRNQISTEKGHVPGENFRQYHYAVLPFSTLQSDMEVIWE